MKESDSFLKRFYFQTSLLHYLLILIFVLFVLFLFQKTIVSNRYYLELSKNNKTKQIVILPARGVFFDRNKKLLVTNDKAKDGNYTRKYLYPEITAHLLGYLSLPNEVNLKDYSCGVPPESKQLLGKLGFEKYFECLIRGETGFKIYEVDALGNQKIPLAKKDPKNGENINLTIDIDLQKKAYQAFGKNKGSIIVTLSKTSDVLVFLSMPSFNTNTFLVNKDLYAELVNDKNNPMFNRLTSGVYPPGSVIKPFLALAGLETSAINAETSVEDTGIFKFGGVSFGNWYFLQYGKKEGLVDVKKAISRSNDIFFYKLGLKMGIESMYKWLNDFDFVGTAVSGVFPQSRGILPNSVWKKKALNEKWYLGDTVNMSIGQGYILVNPLQLHHALNILVNDGKSCELNFINGQKSKCTQKLNFGKDNTELVKAGMKDACSTGGTGWPFFDFKVKDRKITVGCKTGTAESETKDSKPHAWFTVFAPIENPEISATVFVENGGEGSEIAAPIAKQVLKEYFLKY